MLYKRKYIGCNYNRGYIYGGILSSFNGVFNKEEVLIGTGFDYIPCMIGDVSDAYIMLENKIKDVDLNDIEELFHIIFEVVNDYFGGIDNIANRMNNYVDIDFIESEDDIGKVSSLKGKGEAMCTERAMLTQNLLKHLNINSYYKCSSIKINNNYDIHSYNVVNINNKYYIVDTSLPTIRNEMISSLIGEVPEEVYLSLITGEANPKDIDTYSVSVSHYNPLRDKDIEVVYEAGRKNIYTIENGRLLA